MGITKLTRVMLLSLLLVQGVATAIPPLPPDDAPDHGKKKEDGPPVRDNAPPKPKFDLDAALIALNKPERTDAWWEIAHQVIAEIWKDSPRGTAADDAKFRAATTATNDFISKLTSEDNKFSLKGLSEAHAKSLDEVVELSTKEGGNEFSKEAFRRAALKRMEDPSGIWLSKQFGRRIQVAASAAETLKDVKDPNNNKEDAEIAAKLINRMISNLGRKQREDLSTATIAELAVKPPVVDPKILSLVAAAATVSLGKKTEELTVFEQAFKALYDVTLANNKRFHELVAIMNTKPLDDPQRIAAEKELDAKYNRADVADYISHQVNANNGGQAVATAKAFGRVDPTTKELHLDLAASSPGLPLKRPGLSTNLGAGDDLQFQNLQNLVKARAADFGEGGSKTLHQNSGLDSWTFTPDRKPLAGSEIKSMNAAKKLVPFAELPKPAPAIPNPYVPVVIENKPPSAPEPDRVALMKDGFASDKAPEKFKKPDEVSKLLASGNCTQCHEQKGTVVETAFKGMKIKYSKASSAGPAGTEVDLETFAKNMAAHAGMAKPLSGNAETQDGLIAMRTWSNLQKAAP